MGLLSWFKSKDSESSSNPNANPNTSSGSNPGTRTARPAQTQSIAARTNRNGRNGQARSQAQRNADARQTTHATAAQQPVAGPSNQSPVPPQATDVTNAIRTIVDAVGYNADPAVANAVGVVLNHFEGENRELKHELTGMLSDLRRDINSNIHLTATATDGVSRVLRQLGLLGRMPAPYTVIPNPNYPAHTRPVVPVPAARRSAPAAAARPSRQSVPVAPVGQPTGSGTAARPLDGPDLRRQILQSLAAGTMTAQPAPTMIAQPPPPPMTAQPPTSGLTRQDAFHETLCPLPGLPERPNSAAENQMFNHVRPALWAVEKSGALPHDPNALPDNYNALDDLSPPPEDLGAPSGSSSDNGKGKKRKREEDDESLLDVCARPYCRPRLEGPDGRDNDAAMDDVPLSANLPEFSHIDWDAVARHVDTYQDNRVEFIYIVRTRPGDLNNARFATIETSSGNAADEMDVEDEDEDGKDIDESSSVAAESAISVRGSPPPYSSPRSSPAPSNEQEDSHALTRAAVATINHAAVVAEERRRAAGVGPIRTGRTRARAGPFPIHVMLSRYGGRGGEAARHYRIDGPSP